MTQESLVNILTELKKILLEEKEALIQNEGKKIVEIVERKENLVERMEQVEADEQNKDEVQQLVQEIRELQTINSMLTQHALKYVETFISAFQKEAQKKSTYSKEGNYEKTKSTGILDQSL